jgi:hypothetical protein
MKLILRLFILAFLLTSCSSQKSISEKTLEEYKQKGYTLGTLSSQDKGSCPWVITVTDSNVKYDPINIDEAKFASLKEGKSSVFFKFLPLRRQNRCDGIAPIQLVEVVQPE